MTSLCQELKENKLSTDKNKIQVYVNDETRDKFRILTAIMGYKKMSKYAGDLIEDKIKEYEKQHGDLPFNTSSGGGQNK